MESPDRLTTAEHELAGQIAWLAARLITAIENQQRADALVTVTFLIEKLKTAMPGFKILADPRQLAEAGEQLDADWQKEFRQ